ncbi:MAG: hypothetical protein DHS20C09_14200 [marine bacterium B5-7]|nr:MAG: hypothetical protein DHS20C09_14200 [marine bacterium B5-7]
MIGSYLLSGRFQAIAATTFSALISLLLPPLAFLINGSVVALITLRKGAATALQILMISLLVLLAFSLLANLPVELVFGYALVIWLPVWSAATVLRVCEQQGLLLFAVGLLAAVLIVAIYLIIGDVSGWWQQWLTIMLEKTMSPEDIGQYQEVLAPAVGMINAMMIAGFMLNVVISVLCGRWWQSRLFNSGAFRKEFYALSLPPQILPASALIVLLILALAEPWQALFRDIMVVLMFMYLIQGISSVHRNVDKLELSTAWIVSMYCLLVLLPQMALLIACLGMTDVYVAWRRRKIGSKNEL